MQKNEESIGEDLIADFLEEKAIKFDRNPIITKNLEEDNKFFREADFYLPEYKVYIEFLGQWNKPEHKKRYKQKMAVYHKNKIPCIYLWPDNLGTLDWMFRRRLRETLLKYNKKLTLLNYQLENYLEEYGISIIILVAIIYFNQDIRWRIGVSIFLAGHLYGSIRKYVQRLSKIKRSKWVSGKDYGEHLKKEELLRKV